MFKKENLKIGIGASLLIASISLSGCSIKNTNHTPNVSNDATISSTIQNEISNDDKKEESVFSEEETSSVTNPYVKPIEHRLESGQIAFVVPKDYKLFNIDYPTILEPMMEIDNMDVYDVTNIDYEDINAFVAVREEFYKTIFGAAVIQYHLVNGNVDGVDIINLEERESSINTQGLLVPEGYSIVNPYIKEYIDFGIDVTEEGSIMYRMDGEALEGYYGIKSDLTFHYNLGMMMIDEIRENMVLNEERQTISL